MTEYVQVGTLIMRGEKQALGSAERFPSNLNSSWNYKTVMLVLTRPRRGRIIMSRLDQRQTGGHPARIDTTESFEFPPRSIE